VRPFIELGIFTDPSPVRFALELDSVGGICSTRFCRNFVLVNYENIALMRVHKQVYGSDKDVDFPSEGHQAGWCII
jgi:hypothetical protein